VETVRAILAAHPSGISRAGILAWGKLRIDPDFDEARLDAELAALGSEVVERDGFLWLASSDGAPLPTPEPPPAVAARVPEPVSTTPWRAPAGIDGWRAPAGIDDWRAPGDEQDESAGRSTDARPVDEPPVATEPGPIAGWRGSRPRFPPAVVAFLAVLGIALFVTNLLGGSAEGERAAAPTSTTGPTTSAGSSSPEPLPSGSLGSVAELAVGDCIALPTENEFSELLFVACDRPHHAEVFFVGDHPGSDAGYPDDAAFEAFIDSNCLPAFATYTGSAYEEQSVLEVGWFAPTAASWTAGGRTVECYLSPVGGSLTSVSYRGANP
jgi:hypothetical protein